MRIVEPSVEILTPIKGQEDLKRIKKCGCTCYQNSNLINEKGSEEFKQIEINSRRESVAEHCSITVKFITSRSVSHQLVEHRFCSLNQKLQGYYLYNKNRFRNGVVFIKPSWVSDIMLGKHDITWNGIYGLDINDIKKVVDKPSYRWFWNCAISERDYLKLMKEGWCSEKAGEVLSNSTKTEIIVTTNLSGWRTILKQRYDKHTQSEVGYLMTDLLNKFKDKIPIMFDDVKRCDEKANWKDS